MIERHTVAYHRVYYIKREMGWPHERNVPIRLRGYSELIMSRIHPRIRKKIDSAIKRGYTLDQKPDFTGLLKFICKYNPIKPIHIGYVGKTRMDIWLPTEDEAHDLCKELKAQVVMTEALEGKEINTNATPSDTGYYEVYVRMWLHAGGKGSEDQPQLKSLVGDFRGAVDEWMARDAPAREQVAHWCAQSNSTLRIPFDTHQKEDDDGD